MIGQPPTAADWAGVPAWYDTHRADFAAGAADIDTSPTMACFLDGLPPGARILDAGCGSGRDLAAFLARGYAAAGLDASAEMCAESRAATGHRASVRHRSFADLADPPGSWDAIWCLAALLHVPKADWQAVLARLIAALTPRGRLLVAVKQGAGEAIDGRGRAMSFVTEAELARRLRAALPPGAQGRIATWTASSPGSSGESTPWANAILTRTGPDGAERSARSNGNIRARKSCAPSDR